MARYESRHFAFVITIQVAPFNDEAPGRPS
jgi:hypothetical protein